MVGFKLFVPFIMATGIVYAQPKHVIFTYVDHFEPFGTVEDADKMTNYWVKDYMAMASKHTDADGRHPIHTYFVLAWPYMQPEQLNRVLTRLNEVTYTGYGEVEVHIHHGCPNEAMRTEREATEELLNFISMAKQQFNMNGALITAETAPKITFGFVHGNWALDNSRYLSSPGVPAHYEYCGVNRELDILKQEGCYADFTFPNMAGPMSPEYPNINSIFYAVDDDSPASYQNLSNVFPVEVNLPPMNNLMIIQGPKTATNIGVKPDVYYDSPNIRRMIEWVNKNVHVIGNNDWIFVKVYTHGLDCDVTVPETWSSYFGDMIDTFYSDIEKKYNDGVNWKLHYASSREMYNIIKAAEAGKTGNPNDYRDFIIPQYANMVMLTQNQYNLKAYNKNYIWFEMLNSPETVDISFKNFDANSFILESNNEGGPLQWSDAKIEYGQFGELHLKDTTPSRYYYVIKLFYQ